MSALRITTIIAGTPTVIKRRVPMRERDAWGFHTTYQDLIRLPSGRLVFIASSDDGQDSPAMGIAA